VTSTVCSKTNEATKPAETLVENDLKGLYKDVRDVRLLHKISDNIAYSTIISRFCQTLAQNSS
jgi:hypothetical protein